MMRILNGFLSFAAGLVTWAQNPIHAALGLVCAFTFSGIALINFGLDFLGFLFILLYVGAIAVLIVFVIMMLHVRATEVSGVKKKNFLFLVQIFALCLLALRWLIGPTLPNGSFDYTLNFIIWITCWSNQRILHTVGRLLYDEYAVNFLLCGILLLIALIGAIILCLSKLPKRFHQRIERQVSRYVG